MIKQEQVIKTYWIDGKYYEYEKLHQLVSEISWKDWSVDADPEYENYNTYLVEKGVATEDWGQLNPTRKTDSFLELLDECLKYKDSPETIEHLKERYEQFNSQVEADMAREVKEKQEAEARKKKEKKQQRELKTLERLKKKYENRKIKRV